MDQDTKDTQIEHKALGSAVIFTTSKLAPGSDQAPISNSYGRGKRFHLGTDGLGWVVPWCGSQNTRREYVVNPYDVEESSAGPLIAPDYWCESCLKMCETRSIMPPAPLQRCISGNETHVVGKP